MSDYEFRQRHQQVSQLAGKLPAPSAAAQAVSNALTEQIRDLIAAKGPIPFSRYMEMALYAPGLGYYVNGLRKFGEQGDFITAPEISSLFGQCLAQQCGEVLDTLGGGDILEAGAGSGRLARDLLQALAQQDRLPDHYYILELSADLRQRQQELLGSTLPHLVNRVHWLDGFPDTPFRGVVLANELLDALPVERFVVTGNGIELLGVSVEGGQLVDCVIPAPSHVTAALAGIDLTPGYQSELPLTARAWVASLAGCMERGVALLIDYGFPRSEFYHPDRHMGTLMCHYRHRSHGNPLILPGLQDITTHVNFTDIAEVAVENGMDVLGYTSQAAFLMSLGLDQRAAEVMTDSATDDAAVSRQIEIAGQIKKLTLPSEMGELFKVIALGKRMDGPLAGFALQDRRSRL